LGDGSYNISSSNVGNYRKPDMGNSDKSGIIAGINEFSVLVV